MVAMPRTTAPEDETAAVPSQPAPSSVDLASDLLRAAMEALGDAREERIRAEAASAEMTHERKRMDREFMRLQSDNADLRRRLRKNPSANRSLFRSLQAVAGFALAGIVLTGIVFGHDVHGFDPGYIGAALGLLAGTGVWAIRGL